MKQWLSFRENKVFVLCLLVWHGLLFGLAIHFGHIMLGDSPQYLAVATNLLHHGVYYAGDLHQPLFEDFYSRRTPLYPVLILIVKLFSDNDYAICLAQALISLITWCGLSVLLQRQFHYAPRVNRLLLAILFLLPTQFLYVNFIMSEILFQATLFWCFYAAVRYYDSRRPGYLFGVSIFLSLGMLAKPILVYLWIPILLIMFFLAWRTRQWRIVVAGMIPVLTVIGWCTFNLSLTGYYHFSSIKKENLHHYNLAALLTRVRGEQFADSVVDAIDSTSRTIPVFADRMQYVEGESMRWIMKYPMSYGILHAQGMVNFFVDPGRFDASSFLYGTGGGHAASMVQAFGREGYAGLWDYIFHRIPLPLLLYLACVFVGNLILLFSLIFYIVRVGQPVVIKLIIIGIIGYICLLTGHIGAARFKVPLLPVLVFTLPFTVTTIKEMRNRKYISLHSASKSISGS